MSRVSNTTFADRLAHACRYHPNAPADYGQQAWVRRELARLGDEVSSTAVSNWFSGYTHPKPVLTEKLARILNVDVAWLKGEGAADEGERIASRDKSFPNPASIPLEASSLEIPVPVRPGIIARLVGIPADITEAEARRIANVILALAPAKE